ncbi:MAG: heavy-metal-associated domain-containing protein [Clostridia bacterium]|nr:heavy-metal-associated domain-containing protein [Clostridia bacterium]
MEKTIRIDGMMCAHCEARVKKALEGLNFVGEATPDHEKGTALLTLTGDFDEAAVKAAVTDKGYEYKGLI